MSSCLLIVGHVAARYNDGFRRRYVPDLTIRPTMKFIKAGAVLAAIFFLGLETLYLALWKDRMPAWVMVFPPLILLWPALRALRRQYTKVVITGDHLRYEVGATSKSTRNIQLSKVQDVRVDQRVMQRMWNVGNLSIETAGESSRLTIANVDHPQGLADEIMTRAQHGPGPA
jgi:uncharacterized membrane protein YdbT with pleckstrin-like domain